MSLAQNPPPLPVAPSPAPAATRPAVLTPPVAPRVPHLVASPHGERVDDYHWLRDDHPEAKGPQIMAYLQAENAYTAAQMAPLAPLMDRLVAEMRARVKEDDAEVPVYDNGFWYWRRFDAGAEYPVHLRSPGSPQAFDPAATAQVVLDEAAQARGKAFYELGALAVSPDNQWLATTEDLVGRRSNTLRVRHLATGAPLPLAIAGVLESVVWAADSKTIFYIRQDPQTLQSGPVYRHVLGTDPATDELVYDEPDKTLFTGIGRSASREHVLIHIDGFDTTELRAVPAANPAAAPVVVLARRPAVRSYADHLHGRWVIRTNEQAPNFKLVSAPERAPDDRRLWRELIRQRPAAALEDFVVLNDGIVVQERVQANARLRVLPWGPRAAGRQSFVVGAEEPAFAMQLAGNRDPAATAARYVYTSMIRPASDFAVDLASGRRSLLKEKPVLGYERARYDTARLWAPARDGKRIAVSLVWRRDRGLNNARAPLLIEGYGAYGLSFDPALRSSSLSLLDRGFALAIAHVRGGAELGQDWYEGGRLLNKQNTFNDFVDATDFLVREGVAARDLVFASGGSAGGLLMGAIANQAADRYRGLALVVPFVDALNTMLDESIPLTANEWTQWGDPREKKFYDAIVAYSPYDNLTRKAYPAMLVQASLWDAQVQYFEPAKYVARLRQLKTDTNALLLHMDLEAGHGGKSGRFEALRDLAREYAFFLDLAGIRD